MIRRKVDRLWESLFPPQCVFCGTPVGVRHTCCGKCAREIRIWPLTTCSLCGRELPPEIAPGPCGKCLRRPPPQIETQSLFVYAGPVRGALLDWKLHGRISGLDWLLQAAATRLRETFTPDDLLLPLPMPLSRMRRSGLHHTADLSKRICRVVGCRMEWRLLRRVGTQTRQSALRRRDRWQNLRKAFRLEGDYSELRRTRGRLWVVDDICTTGATLYFASRVLKESGFCVHAFSLARLPEEE